ncbi:MAG: SDR family NAD(P)-dependent oxidoreductase [bacterium]
MKRKLSYQLSPVAITGIGCLFPKASNKSMFWANIKNGVDCITEVPHTHWSVDDYYDPDPNRPDHTYSRKGGFLDPVLFDPLEFGIAPNALEATDTSQLLTLLAVKQALVDVGYTNGKILDRDRVSVILGVTGAQQLVIPLGARLYHPLIRKTLMECGLTDTEAEEITCRINHKLVGWQEGSFPGLLGNVVAGRVTNRFDFSGGNCVVDAACAGSLAAVQTACMELQTGKSDLVISGGVDTFNDIFMYMCFSKSKALSPSGHARPFDKSADGTTIGEGVGVIFLKRLEDAEQDGDTIYAVIKGFGASSDGKGNAIYAPSAAGQKKALERAYAEAEISPATVEFVEAHGTGTPVGDAIELEALTDVFRKARPGNVWCALGSVKAQIGHGKAAAGVAGLIKAALALHHKVIPPVVNVTHPAPTLEKGQTPFYLPTEQRPWLATKEHPRRAAVSSFGFGGSNFHCVLEEHSGTTPKPDWDANVQIVAFSAKNAAALSEQIKKWTLPESLDDLRASALETRKRFNPEDSHRLLMVVTNFSEVQKMISTASTRLDASPDEPWETPDGIYYGFGKCPGKLAVVFPGQGTQYPGMLRDLACRFPVFRETLEAADKAFSNHSKNADRLSDVIYPPSTFSKEQADEHVEKLKLTQYAQPGIGAVSIGAWFVLNRHFNVTVDAAAGHSYGEICALCASNMITSEEFHDLSALRGRLMSAGEEDKGGMAAVQAPLEQIMTILEQNNLDLVVANKNAPEQAVISGRSDEIDRAVECFKKHRISIIPLKVSAAFHSPLIADATRPFGKHLDKINFQKADFPVYSNTTGEKYPTQQKKIREILASQLEKPVEFVSEIQQMVADGVKTFVEIGPGKRMTGLIRLILGESGVHLLALDSSSGKRSGSVDLARILAELARFGYHVNLAEWDGNFVPKPQEKASKAQVTLTGTNYVREKPPLPPFSIQRAPATEKAALSVEPSPDDRSHIGASEAFSAIQQNLAGLQRLQEQTARLHQQFLTGQLEAQQAFQNLIFQQQHVLTGSPPPTITTPPLAFTPPPIIAAPTAQPVVPTEDVGVPAAPVDTTPQTAESSQVTEKAVLSVVSEKTGYPIDLLEPDMELDADLGIDSIKRVEIMSAVQEANPGLPTIGPEQMAGIRTLKDIINLIQSLADTSPAQTTQIPESKTETAHPDRQKIGLFDSRPISGQKEMLDLKSVDFVKTIMAEKTGYPVDLLESDMELDADLGIDSIKRVEIMSAVQEKIAEMPTIRPEQLAGLRTIDDIVKLVDTLGGTTDGNQAESEPKTVETIRQDPSETFLKDVPDTAQSMKRPASQTAHKEKASPTETQTGSVTLKTAEIPVLDSAHDLKTEISSAKQSSEPVEKPVQPVVIPEKLMRLDRKIVTVEPVDKSPRKRIHLPEHAEIWITRDDCGLSERLLEEFENSYIPVRLVSPDYLEFVELPDEVAGLIIVSPRDTCSTEQIIKVFELIKLINKKIRRRDTDDHKRPAVISILRLDGMFGLADRPVDYRPISAAFSGLLKTIRLEWPETQCRIIDIDADQAFQPDMHDLKEELFYDGPFETGISADGKVKLVLKDEPIDPERLTGEPLSPGDWILATGGGRGVTAACVIELARRFNVNVVMAGRSSAPEQEPKWLEGLVTEHEIKEAILSNLNVKPTPKELQAEYDRRIRNRELLQTLKTLESLKVQAKYFSVDTSDDNAQKLLFNELNQLNIRIKGLVHGAGIIADKLIEEKSIDDFERVFRTKVDSLRYLSSNLNLDMLKILVLFSSSTARFGRIGQVDYAMANEVLNAYAHKFSKLYPACRTLSINWGPWDGGMVTPELKKLFKNEGIDVIDMPSGARYLARELRMEYGKTSPAPVEIVILGTSEPDTVLPGDIEPQLYDTDKKESEAEPISPSEPVVHDFHSHERRTETELIEVFRANLSIDLAPVLKSHIINNRPVVPMALLMEWAALGAAKNHPSMYFHSLENFRLLKGIVLQDDALLELECKIGSPIHENDRIRIPVELRATHPNGEKFVHASSDVIMVTQLPEPPEPPESLNNPEPYPIHQGQLYEEVLFHGDMLQSIRSIEGINESGITAAVDGAPIPSEWMQHPLNESWILDPLSIDASFQLLVLWTDLMMDMPSLPCGLTSYRQFVKNMPTWCNVEIRILEQRKAQVIADIFFLDTNGKVVAVIEKYECIMDKGLRQAFQAHGNH